MAEALVKDGRLETARAVPPPSDKVLYQVQYYLALGELAEANKLNAGDNERVFWECTQHGAMSIEDALEYIRANPAENVMSRVEQHIRLGNIALDRNEPGAVPGLLESIDALAKTSERTPYDLRVESLQLCSAESLRVRYLNSLGDDAAVRAELERQLKDIKRLQGIAADNAKDAKERAARKNDVLRSFVRSAGEAGHPDLALKASKKISKKERERSGGLVARWFLPASPGAAIDAYESVAGAGAAGALVQAERLNQPEPFFTLVWRAVLHS